MGGPTSQFTIKFDRDANVKTLGLLFDESDGKTLYVIEVKKGPFMDYNEKAEAEVQLRPGDFIMKVNGVEGDSNAMLTELKSKNSFEIDVKHAEEFLVAIDKKEAKASCGIEVPKQLMGNAVLIMKVLDDGPFSAWNAGAGHHKVCEGDRIARVGVKQGKGTVLHKMLTTQKSYQALIVRPAATGQSWSWF